VLGGRVPRWVFGLGMVVGSSLLVAGGGMALLTLCAMVVEM
jgi:hypothetical protein